MKQPGVLLLPLDGMLVHYRVPSMKQPGVLLLPLDGMLVHYRVPSMKQPGVLLLPLDGMLVHYRVPSMKQLGVLLLPLDGMLVHYRVPSMKQLGVLLLPQDGMLVHCSVIPSLRGRRKTGREGEEKKGCSLFPSPFLFSPFPFPRRLCLLRRLGYPQHLLLVSITVAGRYPFKYTFGLGETIWSKVSCQRGSVTKV